MPRTGWSLGIWDTGLQTWPYSAAISLVYQVEEKVEPITHPIVQIQKEAHSMCISDQ
jgi:hypothetical protein